jgi:hypothetical protein
MAKRKDRQYNGQKKGQTIKIVLFVLSFGHCIVCPFFWPLYCLSFLLAIVLFVFFNSQLLITSLVSSNFSRKDKQYNGQKEGQIMQWTKERTDNTTVKRKDKQYIGQKKG